MKSELDQKQLRAMQYWYVDGTYEFNMGGICLVLGIYFLALSKFESTKFADFLNVIMVLVFIGGIFLINWFIRQLKTRVTFPRTGYVSYKRERGLKRITRLIIVGLVAGIIAALGSLAIVDFSAEFLIRTSREYSLNWLSGMTGILMAFAASIFAIRMKISRFYFIAILSIAIGFMTMFISEGMHFGLGLYYALMGVILLVIGGFVLSTYLRSPTPPAEAQNG